MTRDATTPGAPLIYGPLVSWYPLLDPLDAHEEEVTAMLATLRGAGVVDGGALLELGSGAGNNAFFLARTHRCTLVDSSPEMLALSRARNPGCVHVEGDMRSVRLDARFDAVVIHDALSYLLGEADLAATAATAFTHLRPGGVALFAPDCVAEGFREWTEEDENSDGARTLRTLAWVWDPDPTDTTYVVDYALMMREGGVVRVAHDHHVEGLFPTATWERLLSEAGFTVRRAARAGAEELEGTGYTGEVFLAARAR